MTATQDELDRVVREMSQLLPAPSDPDDMTVPIPFGSFGMVFMTDNGAPILGGTYNDFEAMERDAGFLSVFAEGMGTAFFVSYGAFLTVDDDGDPIGGSVVRLVLGVTPDLNAGVFLNLATGETISASETDSSPMTDRIREILYV